MEIINDPNKPDMNEAYAKHRRGRVITGIIFLGAGALLLLKTLGYFVPAWLLSWKMLLIVIGIAIGIKHNFKRATWIIPVLIGSFFLLADLFPELVYKPLILPIVIIGIGAFMIFRPSRRCNKKEKYYDGNWKAHYHSNPVAETTEDRIEITSVFGGIKKNIVSKNFQGGEITCVFGGAEVNLMQCDFSGKITLEANQVLGGTKLIIPSNWQIQSESVAVLGGIDDKRPTGLATDPTKVLVLRGTSVLGGLEILSYQS